MADGNEFTLRGKPIEKYRVTELRDECDSRNLLKTGNKKDIIQRICEDIQAGKSRQNTTPELPALHSEEMTKSRSRSVSSSSRSSRSSDKGNRKKNGRLSKSRSSSRSGSDSRSRSRSKSKSSDSSASSRSRSSSASDYHSPGRKSEVQKKRERSHSSSSDSSRDRSNSKKLPHARSRDRSNSKSSQRARSYSGSSPHRKSQSKSPPPSQKLEQDSPSSTMNHEHETSMRSIDETTANMQNDKLDRSGTSMEVEESDYKADTERTDDSEYQTPIKLNTAEKSDNIGNKLVSSSNVIGEKAEENIINNETTENREKPIKKRKWGSSSSKITKRNPSLEISTDSLKSLIPEMKPLLMPTITQSSEENVSEGEVDDPGAGGDTRNVKVRRTVVSRDDSDHGNIVLDKNTDTITDTESGEITEPPKERKQEIKKPKPLIETEEPQAADREPSPAKNPANNTIHISGLTRPFTVGQLKELAKKIGEVDEASFWIDKIKSHCYIAYLNEDDAKAARKAFHGTRWPTSNPKKLRVDFATPEDVESHRAHDAGPAEFNKKETREEARKRRAIEREKRHKEKEEKQERENETKKSPVSKPIREWDRDKIRQRSRTRSRSPHHRRHKEAKNERNHEKDHERERIRDDSRNDSRNERKEKEKPEKKVEEAPAKLLDDLFRKTKAAPCIYWLPLTDAEVEERIRMRKARLEERDKIRRELDQKEAAELRKRRYSSPDRREQVRGRNLNDNRNREKKRSPDYHRRHDRDTRRQDDSRDSGNRNRSG